MQISYLADHPEFVTTLASWFYAQWGFFLPGSAVETFVDRIRAHMNRDALPLALVAHAGATLLGSASLRPHDMDNRPHLTPWLGGVYVEQNHRRQRIGATLAQAVEDKAKALGCRVLYLFTFDKEAYYRTLGWDTLEPTEYRGHSVIVMQKRLAQPLVQSTGGG